jgi:endonuclease YncB( thermonuclease family)
MKIEDTPVQPFLNRDHTTESESFTPSTLQTPTTRRAFIAQGVLACASTVLVPNDAHATAVTNTRLLPFDPFPQFQTVDDVPKTYFTQQKSIYAFVERVIDGDTIRVRHYPLFSIRRQRAEPLQKRGIADSTLSIRFYGIDCPEIAKTKSQKSQPFAEEAKDYISQLVLYQMVKITFLRKDQYGRAICQVQTLPRFGSLLGCIPGLGAIDLSVELARKGLAELYTGGNAEYFDKRELLEREIKNAKKRRQGIWSLGKSRVSAAEAKKRLREQNEVVLSSIRGEASSNKRECALEKVMTGLEFSTT